MMEDMPCRKDFKDPIYGSGDRHVILWRHVIQLLGETWLQKPF